MEKAVVWEKTEGRTGKRETAVSSVFGFQCKNFGEAFLTKKKGSPQRSPQSSLRSMIHKIVILVLLSGVIVCHGVITKGCGQSYECTCPAEAPNVVEVCASDEDPRCLGKYETAVTCKTFSELFPLSNVTSSEYTGSETGEAWQCGGTGAVLTCPAKKRTISVCSSAKGTQCGSRCANKAVHSCDCSEPPAPYAVSTAEGYWITGSDGKLVSCGNQEVVCGTCLSGEDPGCSNVKATSRVKCCKMLDCTPTKITGQWFEIMEGFGPASTQQVSIGVAIGGSYSMSEEIATTLSVSVSKGFEFSAGFASAGKSVQVDGEVSKQMSMSASKYFGMSVSLTTTQSCPYVGPVVLWQFRYIVEGNCPSTVYLNSFACTQVVTAPPCCLPGNILDMYSQQCVNNTANVCTGTYHQL